MSAPALRISRSHYPVTALGPGSRLGVWVQGCPLACKGCMSQDTWDPDGGVEVTVEDLLGRWRAALADGATGLTVSGGEPLEQAGPLGEFLRRAAEVRSEGITAQARYGEPDILLYTGYELTELDTEQRAATQHADALITGRYLAGQPTDLVWRGSENQRLRPRTELGRRRYAAFVDQRVTTPALQLRVDASGVWLIGVPRPGTLGRIDRMLRQTGLAIDGVTWRPSGGAAGPAITAAAAGSGGSDGSGSADSADGTDGTDGTDSSAGSARPNGSDVAAASAHSDRSVPENEVLPCPND